MIYLEIHMIFKLVFRREEVENLACYRLRDLGSQDLDVELQEANELNKARYVSLVKSYLALLNSAEGFPEVRVLFFGEAPFGVGREPDGPLLLNGITHFINYFE